MPYLLKFISSIPHDSLLQTYNNFEAANHEISIGPPFESIDKQMKKYHQHVVAINSGTTMDFTGVKKGVSPGDTIDFVGPNYIIAEDMKAFIVAHLTLTSPAPTPLPFLSVNAESSTATAEVIDNAQRHSDHDKHVLYLHQTTRRNFGTTQVLLNLQNKEPRFHLLPVDGATTLDSQQERIDKLEAWLELHMQHHVLWVIWDNVPSNGSSNSGSSNTQQFNAIDSNSSLNNKGDTFYFHELKRLQKKWNFILLLNSTHIQQQINIDFRFQFLSERDLQMIWPVHMDKFRLIAEETETA